jgi:hypothetical protein
MALANCTEAQSQALVAGQFVCFDTPWKCAVKYPQAGQTAVWTVTPSTKLCTLAPSPSPTPLPWNTSAAGTGGGGAVLANRTGSGGATTNGTGGACASPLVQLCASPSFAGLQPSCVCVPGAGGGGGNDTAPSLVEGRSAKEGVNCENAFFCFFTDTLPYALASVFGAGLLLLCLGWCIKRRCCPDWRPYRGCGRCCRAGRGKKHHRRRPLHGAREERSSSSSSRGRRCCCPGGGATASASRRGAGHGANDGRRGDRSRRPRAAGEEDGVGAPAVGKANPRGGGKGLRRPGHDARPSGVPGRRGSLDLEGSDPKDLARILAGVLEGAAGRGRRGRTRTDGVAGVDDSGLGSPPPSSSSSSSHPLAPWRTNPLHRSIGEGTRRGVERGGDTAGRGPRAGPPSAATASASASSFLSSSADDLLLQTLALVLQGPPLRVGRAERGHNKPASGTSAGKMERRRRSSYPQTAGDGDGDGDGDDGGERDEGAGAGSTPRVAMEGQPRGGRRASAASALQTTLVASALEGAVSGRRKRGADGATAAQREARRRDAAGHEAGQRREEDEEDEDDDGGDALATALEAALRATLARGGPAVLVKQRRGAGKRAGKTPADAASEGRTSAEVPPTPRVLGDRRRDGDGKGEVGDDKEDSEGDGRAEEEEEEEEEEDSRSSGGRERARRR